MIHSLCRRNDRPFPTRRSPSTSTHLVTADAALRTPRAGERESNGTVPEHPQRLVSRHVEVAAVRIAAVVLHALPARPGRDLDVAQREGEVVVGIGRRGGGACRDSLLHRQLAAEHGRHGRVVRVRVARVVGRLAHLAADEVGLVGQAVGGGDVVRPGRVGGTGWQRGARLAGGVGAGGCARLGQRGLDVGRAVGAALRSSPAGQQCALGLGLALGFGFGALGVGAGAGARSSTRIGRPSGRASIAHHVGSRASWAGGTGASARICGSSSRGSVGHHVGSRTG